MGEGARASRAEAASLPRPGSGCFSPGKRIETSGFTSAGPRLPHLRHEPRSTSLKNRFELGTLARRLALGTRAETAAATATAATDRPSIGAGGLQRGWIALLPLMLLPIANSVPALRHWHADAAVLAAALAAWTCVIINRSSPASAIAMLGACGDDRRIGAWEFCLLAFVVVIAIAYLVVGSRVRVFAFPDGTYYYGVARHIALTGRFEEPIVWHFLHLPTTIRHAPFDYWGCMTALLLVPPLVLFGATPMTAMLTMAALSAGVLVAFWYLICVALPLRHCATQLLALVTFAFSPALDLYRFQTESITVAHLFLLLALIAVCRRRSVLAILAGFGMVLTRGDGMIFFSLIVLAVLLQAWRGVDREPRHPWRLLLVALACLGTYVLWNVASFGTLTPPSTQIVPFLKSYWQVYDFGVMHEESWSSGAVPFQWPAVLQRLRIAFSSLRALPIAPALDGWLLVGACSAVWLIRRRADAQWLIWVLCFIGYFLVAAIAGSGFAPVRTPYTFVPLVILSGALGADAILTRVAARMERGAWGHAAAAAIGAGVLGLCAFVLGRLVVFQATPMLPDLPAGASVSPEALSKLDEVLNGEPVASNLPWQIIAYTRSPAISVPWNGEAAIDSALAHYQVGWLVLFGSVRDCKTDNNASCPVFMRVLGSETTSLGRFRIERVSVDEGLPAVFRVSSNSQGFAAPEPGGER
jgi:hypothetical protein